jgi:nucleotide-binding universal stress UspA family protein
MTYKPKCILVPTDFSDGSDRALGLANKIAERFGAELHILHVRVVLDDPNIDAGILDEVERILTISEPVTRQALEEVGANGNPRIHPHMKRGMIPSDVIIDAIEEYSCDLVIMGTHGRRGFTRLLAGSVAQEIVHRSPVPVITTHADADSQVPPRKILVPVDFSDECLEAVEWANAIAPALGARITLLHVIQPIIYPEFYALDSLPEEHTRQVVKQCHEALEEIAQERLPDHSCDVVVVEGHVADSVRRYALDHDQDLTVVASRGLSGVARAVLGSVAERLVRCCEVPVLTVKVKDRKTVSRTGLPLSA